jgi:threonine/homoserine/homoserine lactone efflux protein
MDKLHENPSMPEPFMPFDTLITLSALPAGVLFALVTTITPGPNNTMLLASGVNFGFRRTVPHVLGISAGVALLMLSVGFGLGEAFRRLPMLYTVLETASVVYLLYLAWKIGTSGEVQVRKGERRPMRFHEAIAFQWVNPKAWMMVLTAATTIHLSADFGFNALLMAVLFYVIGLPCICLWAAFGTGLRSFLSNPVRLRTFNIVMALLLVLSMYPVILHMLG